MIQSNGAPAPFATILVCPYSSTGTPCTPTASIYSNLALTNSIPNPYTTDQYGNFTFFVSSGVYNLQISVGGGVVYPYTATTGTCPGCVLLSPSGNQTITQPAGTSLMISSFNSVVYAQPGASLATVCSGFTGTVEVTTPLTISSTTALPATCGLKIENGGSISVAAGQYLQIAGPFDAGLYPVFTGPGAVYFYGGAGPKEVLPQWFGAEGNAKASGYDATPGNSTITIVGRNPWVAGDSITLAGGGVSGANYTTSASAVTPTSVTVALAPSTAVSNGAAYNVDDSAALNAWASSVRGTTGVATTSGYEMQAGLGPSLLYVPKGQYNVCTAPVVIYSGAVLRFEGSNTTHSAVFQQCNPLVPAIQMNANNYSPTGTVLNQGNGNNTLDYVNIRGSYAIGGTDTPALQFLNAANLVSDTRINHLMCEAITGSCVVVGFQTTTSAALLAGATVIPVANGATLFNGTSIIIPGAGTGGTNLITQILSGGGTNSLTVTTAVVTGVSSGTAVWPATDSYGLWINQAELDTTAGGRFLEANGNASGTIWVDNSEVYSAVYGAAVSTSNSPVSLRWTNNKCFGCGSYNDPTAHQSYAIDWEDASKSKLADVTIDNSSFNGLNPGATNSYTGGVEVSGARSFQVKNSQFWYVDNPTNYKGILSQANNYVDIEGNTLISNLATSATGSYLIELCCSSSGAAIDAIVKGNTLNNINATLAISQGINVDVAPTTGTFNTNLFSGNITLPGYPSGVIRFKVDQMPGATADAKIAACFTAVNTLGGGTCDATGFGSTTQTIASTVTLAGTTGEVTLLCDPATSFAPTSTGENMFTVGLNVTVNGCTVNLPSSYVGSVYTLSAARGTNGWLGTELENLQINGITGTGTAFTLTSSSGSTAVLFAKLHDISVANIGTALQLTASGSGAYVNGNDFSRWIILNANTVVDFNAASGATTPIIQGNRFQGFYVEGGSVSGRDYFQYDGTGDIWNNVSTGTMLFDLDLPDKTNNTGAGDVANNDMEGYISSNGVGWTPNYANTYKVVGLDGNLAGIIGSNYSIGKIDNASRGGLGVMNLAPTALSTFPNSLDGINIDPATGNIDFYLSSTQGSSWNFYDTATNTAVASIGNTGVLTNKGLVLTGNSSVSGASSTGTLAVGTGSTINRILYVTSNTLTPTSVSASSCSDQTFTGGQLANLVTSDILSGIVPPAALGNVSVSGYVSAGATLNLHFCNPSATGVTPPSGAYTFTAVH